MDALHYPDEIGNPVTEFNLHSMYGFYMSMETNNYFMNYKKLRAFILSRSTFVGSGRYTSHWLGDNLSTYLSMKDSIAGIMNFQLFGVVHVGADV